MPSDKFQWLQQAVLPMDVVLLRSWHSALRGRGSAPAFSRVKKWQFIRNIAIGFYKRQRTTRSIWKSYSILAGLMHLTVCCAMTRSLHGKRLGAPRRVSDPVKAKWWRGRSLVGKLFVIVLIRQLLMLKAILMLYRSGQVRALD